MESAADWPLLGLAQPLGHLAVPVCLTLAYTNEHRPAGLYRDLFFALLECCRLAAPGHKFRFKNELVSLDVTVIVLYAQVFD